MGTALPKAAEKGIIVVMKVMGKAGLLGAATSGAGMLLGAAFGGEEVALLCSRALGLCFVGWIVCTVFSPGTNPWTYDLSHLKRDNMGPASTDHPGSGDVKSV